MKQAFIDIGTNSIRYLAAEIKPGIPPLVLARGLMTPRLGASNQGGKLDPDSIFRAARDLNLIVTKLRLLGINHFRAVGTEALRQAFNRDEFLREALNLGIEVEVISGKTEAELVRGGVLFGSQDQEYQTLLVDIGGGSSEFIFGDNTISLPLGCVQIWENFGPKLKGARAEIGKKLQPLPKIFTSNPQKLAGLGGTFTTLGAINLGLEPYRGEAVHGLILDRAWIEQLFARLGKLSLKQRKNIRGLPEDRADIILAGTAIVLEVMTKCRFVQATISDHGILFGLLAQAQP